MRKFRRIAWAIAALAVSFPGYVIACTCPMMDEVTAEQGFLGTQFYAHGTIESIGATPDPRDAFDGIPIKIRITNGMKGARDGDLVDSFYKKTSCISSGEAALPTTGYPISLKGFFTKKGVKAAACFVTGPDDEYQRLMTSYPQKRDARFNNASASGTSDGWLKAAQEFLRDGDPRSAQEALSRIPSADVDDRVAILAAKTALNMNDPDKAIRELSARIPGTPALNLMHASAHASAKILNATTGNPYLSKFEIDAKSWDPGFSDFTDLSLTNLSIVSLKAPNSDWRRAGVSYSLFRDVDLSLSKLDTAGFTGSSFVTSSLRGANLSNSSMRNVTFTNVDLQGAIAERADFKHARFVDVRASGLKAEDIDLTQTDLSGADLSGARLNRGKLTNAKLGKANLMGADLSEADLRYTDLRGVDLSLATLTSVKLYGSQVDCDTKFPAGTNTLEVLPLGGSCEGRYELDFSKRPFEVEGRYRFTGDLWKGADLQGAKLRKKRFGNFDFTGTNFGGADLSGSTLGSMKEVNLTNADLSDTSGRAFLFDADLRGATISGRVPAPKHSDPTMEHRDAESAPMGALELNFNAKSQLDGLKLSNAWLWLHAEDRPAMTALIRKIATLDIEHVKISCLGKFNQQIVKSVTKTPTETHYFYGRPPADPEMDAAFAALLEAKPSVSLNWTCDSSPHKPR